MSLAWCRTGTVDHPSEGRGQLLPGPTITLGTFLQLLVAPYGYMPVLILLLQCSGSFHYGLFFRDLLMHHYTLSPLRLAAYSPDRPLLLLGRPSSLFTRHSYLLPFFPGGHPSYLLFLLIWPLYWLCGCPFGR
jgi:hypothetical protein